MGCRVLPLAYFKKSQIKEVVGESSGVVICFADGSVLHAREGHIFQNGDQIRINSHNINLRLFAEAFVTKVVLKKRCSLNIHVWGKKGFRIEDGFLVAGGRTFDINGGQRLTERGIYLQDGV